MSRNVPIEHFCTAHTLADYPRVSRLIQKRSPPRRHLAANGLAEHDVVLLSADKRLPIDREAFVQWLYGDQDISTPRMNLR